MGLSERYLIQQLGAEQTARLKQLKATAQMRELTPAEVDEVDNLASYINSNLQPADRLKQTEGFLSELRGNLEFAGSDKAAKAIGQGILDKYGIPGRIVQLQDKYGKTTNQFAIYDDASGKVISINPKGFDKSDLAALGGQLQNFIPLATTIGGAVLAGPMASAGAGAGSIAGEGIVAGMREAQEEKYAPQHQTLPEHLSDVALNTLGYGVGGNVAGAVLGKGLSSVARAVVPEEAVFKNPAVTAAVQGIGKALPEGTSSISAKLAKQAPTQGIATVSARIAKGAGNIADAAIQGYQNALYNGSKNTFVAFGLGTEKVIEGTIEQGIKAGKSNAEIREMLQRELDDYNTKISTSLANYQKAQQEFAASEANLKSKTPIKQQDLDIFNANLQGYVDKTMQDISARKEMFLDQAIDAFRTGNKAKAAELTEQITQKKTILDKIDNDIFALSKLTKTDDPIVKKKIGAIYTKYNPVPANSAISTDALASKADVGNAIFTKVSTALKSGMQAESQGYNQAITNAQFENTPLAGAQGDLVTVVEEIKQNLAPTTPDDVRNIAGRVLKNVGTEGTGRDILQLGKNITEVLGDPNITFSKAEQTALYNLRGKVISNTADSPYGPSILRKVAGESPAAAQYLQTNAERVARNDALTPFVTSSIVNNADLTTGQVARRENTDVDVYEAYKNLVANNSPNNPTVELVNQYAGIDDNLKEQFAQAYAREAVDAAKGDPTKLMNLQFDQTHQNISKQFPSVTAQIDNFVNQGKQASDTAVEAEINALFGGIDAKNQQAITLRNLEKERSMVAENYDTLLAQEKALKDNEARQILTEIPKQAETTFAPEIKALDKFGGTNAGVQGLDNLIKRVNEGSQVGYQEAKDILDASNATPEVRTTIFNKIISGDLANAASKKGGYVQLATEFGNAPRVEGSNVPQRFSVFGEENVVPQLDAIQDIGQKQQALMEAQAQQAEIPKLGEKAAKVADKLQNFDANPPVPQADAGNLLLKAADLVNPFAWLSKGANATTKFTTDSPTASALTTPLVKGVTEQVASDRTTNIPKDQTEARFDPYQGTNTMNQNKTVPTILAPVQQMQADTPLQEVTDPFNGLLQKLYLDNLAGRTKQAVEAFKR